jgi:hypothetical protein
MREVLASRFSGPEPPFSSITIADTGEAEQVWTSFGTVSWSEQVDVEVTSNAGQAFIAD